LDIAKTLSKHQSRINVQAVADYIGGEPARFAELMRVFDSGDRRMKQCSAWPMSVVAEKHPELLDPYLGKLVEYLPRKDVHNAVKRSVTRLLQFVEVPKCLHAKVFSYCTDLVGDAGEPVAVRCFAMTAAARIAEGNPALTDELKMVAGKQLEHATAGLRVRIKRLMTEG
jgi:hypothetical protein